jgi:hypothetical protein
MTANADPPLLSEIARLFAQRAGQYCLSAAIAGVLGVAALTALYFWIRGDDVTRYNPIMFWHSLDGGKQFGFIFGFILAVWTPVLLGARATCRITTAQLAGQELASGAIVADMLRFLPAALVYALVIGLPALIGLNCLFMPGLLIAACFTLLVPVSVNEPVGFFAALRRNFSLIGKVFGGSFLITFLCAVVIAAVVVLMAIGIDPFLTISGVALLALRFAIIYVPVLLLMVLANVGFTLIYFAVRRAEHPVANSAYPQAGPGG